MTASSRPVRSVKVLHVIQNLVTGGLENGLVNLINSTQSAGYRHAILCLGTASSFRERLQHPSVGLIEIRKQRGIDLPHYWRLARAFLRERPDILHTRNFGALDSVALGRLCGVPACVHGEHGWDVDDLDGTSAKRIRYRKAVMPFVTQYVAVTEHIAGWLTGTVGVPAQRVECIPNGVDVGRFSPGLDPVDRRSSPSGASSDFVIGTVGRLAAVKNQRSLIAALARLRQRDDPVLQKLRLVIVGDGPLRKELHALASTLGVGDRCEITGDRADVPDLMRRMDLFVLPSLNEGMSNTLLEAMATGLPVIATAVGGNVELVRDGETGLLVEVASEAGLIEAILRIVRDPGLACRLGVAARAWVERERSLGRMVEQYASLYDRIARFTAGSSRQ